MEQKKIYIIFTYGLYEIGGTQMFVAGKAKYLYERGWKVYVFHPGAGKCVISNLPQYAEIVQGTNFFIKPPYKIKAYEKDYLLNMLRSRLNISNPKDCEIIIESHTDTFAYWAELLAAQIGARHFFLTCNEVYRDIPSRHYEDNLDFFEFKWKRNELVASGVVLEKLFNGYKNINEPLAEMPPTICEQNPIQDVHFKIENVKRLDWNICHLGRAAKEYVPYVIQGVGELARRHPDKRINFIMIGNADVRMGLIKDTFKNLPNVLITLPGDMVPIPRIIFSKIDVVCGISQSARFAANEGVLTICASVKDKTRTPGVLGYDTEDQIFGEGTFSYVEALENVLLKKIYAGKKYSLPKLKPEEEYYDNFWTIVNNASPVKEYYTERLSRERIREWTAIFPFGIIGRGARIILFGENEITKDYRKQIESQNNLSQEFGRDYTKNFKPCPYCQAVATVDEHPENFDDTVVGLERLKTKDYDAIVLCSFPQNAQAAYNKIVQVVPDMAQRVVYNFRTVPT